MHQVLLFFFAKILFTTAQFLYANEEKDTIHIGLYTKALF